MSATESQINAQLKDDTQAACLSGYSIFAGSPCRDDVEQPRQPDLLKELFEHVGSGKEEEAEKILCDHTEFLSERRKLTDISNSVYHDIALFEYAVCEDVQDVYMARMIVECIKNRPDTQELAAKLAIQFDNVFSNKIPKSIQTVIFRLETLEKNYFEMEDNDFSKAWITEVGGAQRELKAVIRNQYCHPNFSFVRDHGFNDEQLPRELKFYRSKTDEIRTWDKTASDLGVYFAISRWSHDATPKKPGARAISGKNLSHYAIRADIDALKSMCTANSQNLLMLRQEIASLCNLQPAEKASFR